MPTLLLALPIPLFVALGLWQLDRADQKRLLAETLAARAELPVLRIDALVTDADALRYRRIEATGRLVAEDQFLIEGRREGGKTGFHVITPLKLADSDALLLVNRGWIPADSKGEPTAAPVPEGVLTLAGEADIPSPPALVLHGGDDAAKAWGGRWPYLTLDLFAATAELPVQPVVMLLNPEDPNGFVRHWTRPVPNVWMHQGYAAQWFGFALIALVLYLRLSVERAPGRESGQ
ncbi:MAG: SURF1 family protein [Chromatiaceae bacterium]